MAFSTVPSSFLHLKAPSFSFNPSSLRPQYRTLFTSFSSSKPIVASASKPNSRIRPTLESISKAAILIGVTASFASRFSILPAKAETPATFTEKTRQEVEQRETEEQTQQTSPLSEFLESNTEAIETLKSLLQKALENGEDEEALKILHRLDEAQPLVIEWKFLMARLYNEMGRTQEARNLFDEILRRNPLSFEALFENALLMDRCGDGENVIRRLQEALEIAESENKVKEARDVRFIMAQIQFLQKNVEKALKNYQELSREDPNDFRPYFCQGIIYSLLDKNEEAREQFAKYRKLSPKKFEVDGYLRTPLSRMKLFGSNEEK